MLAALRLPIKSLPPMFTIFCELPATPFIILKSSSSLSLCLIARPPVLVVSSAAVFAIRIYYVASTMSIGASMSVVPIPSLPPPDISILMASIEVPPSLPLKIISLSETLDSIMTSLDEL